jgi:hypothetical protein
MTKWIRPSVNISYESKLGGEAHALLYRNLLLDYLEEQVRVGRRGLAVVARTSLAKVAISEYFAYTDVCPVMDENTEAERRRYRLETTIDDNELVYRSGLLETMSLPYGIPPVHDEEVEYERTEAGLVTHLQQWLLTGFEVDAIEAVIGDYSSADEVAKHRERTTETLREAWEHISGSEVSAEDAEVPAENWFSLMVVRTLYSPVVRLAFYAPVDKYSYAR